MAAVDVGVKGAIITGGLGRPACRGMITVSPFQLLCEVATPVQPAGRTGGSIPLAPGEIGNLYQPIEGGSSAVGLPGGDGKFVDPSVYGKKHIRIVLKMNEYTIEKEYMIRDKHANYVVNIINMVNVTKQRMKVMASNIRRITTAAVVKVKNIHIKYFDK